MKARSFKQAIFALWALGSIMPYSGFAGSIDDLVQKAYRLGEDDAKKQLDLFFESAKIERKRKEMAGVPPATAKEASDALEGVKFLIYNRAATNGICAESAFKASGNVDIMQACIENRNASMEKFMKLGDYKSLPSARSGKDCELLGRDFEAERRFPPFDFLRAGLGPPLFNFEIVNSCLMSDH